MPPRRSRQRKSLKGRVQKLVTRDEHEKLLRKSKKRLVVILYYTTGVAPQQTQAIRSHFNSVSKKQGLNNVSFGELDVTQPEFEDLAASNSISTFPAFQLIRNEESIQVLTGIQLSALEQQCLDNAGLLQSAGQSSSAPPSRWKQLLTGGLVVGAVAAAGYFGYRYQNRNRVPTQDQLADIDGKLKDARARLAYLTKRRQHGPKREQQKRVTALEDKRQAIINSQQALKPGLVSLDQHSSSSDSSDSDSD